MSLYTFILVQFCSSRNFGTHATQKQFFRLFIIIYLFIILASDTLGPNIIYFRGFFPLEPPILIVSLLHRSRETKCNILIYIKMNLISSLGVKNCKIFSINQIVSLGFEFSIATLVTGSQFKYQGKKLSNFNLKMSLHLKGVAIIHTWGVVGCNYTRAIYLLMYVNLGVAGCNYTQAQGFYPPQIHVNLAVAGCN